MSQDTGKFRTNLTDQFYTKIDVARQCVDTLLELRPATKTWTWVEPSAGTGSFLRALPEHFEKIAIDIDPKWTGVIKKDFLEWSPISNQNCILFGNPPFGRQGSMAKAFIRHGSQFSDVIAFVLPRSFVKPSMTGCFPPKFHMIHSVELPKNSFEVNGKDYDVPCVFQIWERKETDRENKKVVESKGFRYVKPTEQYHIALRRVGVRAGQGFLYGSGDFSPSSHYFLNFEPKLNHEILLESLNGHEFPSNTVGPRSLSKSEINEVLNEFVAAGTQSP